MTDFFDIPVPPSVPELQERKGSRRLYVIEVGAGPGPAHELTGDEIDFLRTRDSFYLASVGETGWPYVQHRGGDIGFLKVLDSHTIGWAERNGNRQYIGTGNIADNGRVSAIFVDYPTRSRLKIYGQATHHPEPSEELLRSLGAEDLRTDGAITIEILATAWNCPKYITPRFTEPQIRGGIAQMEARILELEDELEALRKG